MIEIKTKNALEIMLILAIIFVATYAILFSTKTPIGQARLPVTIPPEGSGGGGSICGNAICNAGENSENCFVDCGVYLKNCTTIDGFRDTYNLHRASELCTPVFPKCVAGIYSRNSQYWSSTNGTCSGTAQTESLEFDVQLIDCDQLGPPSTGPPSCTTATSGGEPLSGDISYQGTITGAICCN